MSVQMRSVEGDRRARARAAGAMRSILCAAACALAIAAGSGCRVELPNANHASNQILYTSSGSDPRTFNPILVTDATSDTILGQVFDSLIRINPKTTLPEPSIAQSWDISPDQKTITFHLRHDVKWFDGRPVTARDVLFTFKVIYDDKIPNSMRPGLLVDAKPIPVTAPDDYTVVMNLPRPFAPLLYSAGIPVMPEHLLGPVYAAGAFNHAWGIDAPPTNIIGDGPYRLARYVASQSVQLSRNPTFWMKDEHGGELPRLHGRNILIVQDPNAAYLRFLAGQLDVYGPRPEEVIDLRDKASRLKINVEKIGISTGSLFFCFNRNPRYFVKKGVTSPKLRWFTDLNFLRAIAHAIDKQAMINLCFHGMAVPAVSDVSPANKVFHDPDLKDYDYDLSLAAQLLEAGGYHLLRPGVRVDANGNRLEFNLMSATTSPEQAQMCAIFKQDLASLGIKVNYHPLEFTTVVEKLDATFDWDCVLIGFTGTIDPNDGSNFYRSSGNLHLWYPSQKAPATPWEAQIDQMLDQGASVMDPLKRAPYYWQIQKILHDQLAIIMTVRPVGYQAWKQSLENYDPTEWGVYHPEWIEFRPQ
jgi:peptide/nickel transport system substrate-binding protein